MYGVQLSLVIVGMIGLVVVFVTLPQVIILSDNIRYCQNYGKLLEMYDVTKCDNVREMSDTMLAYFTVSMIVGVAAMLFVVAGLLMNQQEKI